MAIRIEFYGIARQRAGLSELSLEPPQASVPLRHVFSEIAARTPWLAGELIVDGRLHSTLRANLDGQRFISDPSTMIRDGQSVLILSADGGG